LFEHSPPGRCHRRDASKNGRPSRAVSFTHHASRITHHVSLFTLHEKMAARFACNVSAYVLMTSYGVWSNRRYDRGGHLFRSPGFKAVILDPNQWAVSLTRYIHLDPVRTRPAS
jgi:hypothetical protein